VTAARSVVIHGHFYQPPREDPATGLVPVEASAAPDHDWNARITRQCYAPLAAARIGSGARARQLNAFAWLSFDAGPTLLDWMEREAPGAYAAILAGDRESARRLGHGNALAMPYHHLILPLASRRDKTTEVRWGLADFRRRFGRDAAGMWLPETAVDDETLDVLAAEGVAFTVLAPHQVAKPPARGLPARYRTSAGRWITLCLYDGPLSHDVAFGALLQDSAAWERRLFADPAAAIVAVATDGETYGHHHTFGELALAALLDRLARRPDAEIENFASLLARAPASESVALVTPSSWSCVHGVERWRDDCGCRITPGTQQRWRAPVREAVDWLAGEVHALFAREAAPLVGDAWDARDAAGGTPLPGPAGRAAELLEAERSVLRAFTSCGWFFDDFAALEGRMVLRYAARAVALAGADSPRLEAGFVERLAPAVSNDPAMGTAADVYRDVKGGR
jgi:alpha-amylase/alpha-mannosidase (GH57 family)